jgi:3-methyl-2-oxobutanoate hydroxymethyltransferase
VAQKIEYILALGSNVGNRQENLRLAREGIAAFAQVVRTTEILETWPILIRAQGKFLNQALHVISEKNPHELLLSVQGLEGSIGRKKRIKNGPREIDIDIVWTSAADLTDIKLRVPHPFNRAREWIRHFMGELKRDTVDSETQLPWSKIQGRAVMNIHDFVKKKAAGEKIAVVTCYDHAFARLIARTSLDAILVGDSMGNVIQGQANTLAVTIDDIIYHTKAVKRGAPQNFIIADMPFMSYQVSVEECLRNAGRIIKESGADAVKLEGGEYILPQVRALVTSGIPVMGHLGFTPQSLLAFGGYKVQGKTPEAADTLIKDARSLEEAGCFGIVLEMVPSAVTQKISHSLRVPTIGIGAGASADGQVLVLTDLLGLDPDFTPRFVRKYADLSGTVLKALEGYAADVRGSEFPTDKETFT